MALSRLRLVSARVITSAAARRPAATGLHTRRAFPPTARGSKSGVLPPRPPPSPRLTPCRAAHYVSGPDPTASFDAILDDDDEDRPDFDWARDGGGGASASSPSPSSDPRSVARAVNLAAAALARRPHGRAELEGKLVSRHGLTRATAAAGVARLVELGLQSDAEFAAAFARGKWRSGAWAPRRIAAELGRRGVGPGPIAAALEGLFGSATPRLDAAIRDGPVEGDDGSPSTSMPGDEWLPAAERGAPGSSAPAHLLAAAARQAALSAGLPPPARRRRLVGWLQRRGHGWGTVKAVLDALAL